MVDCLTAFIGDWEPTVELTLCLDASSLRFFGCIILAANSACVLLVVREDLILLLPRGGVASFDGCKFAFELDLIIWIGSVAMGG